MSQLGKYKHIDSWYELFSSVKMAEENKNSEGAKEFTELDWIALKNDLGTAQMKTTETSSSKFYRKFNENPFVPIGKCIIFFFYI